MAVLKTVKAAPEMIENPHFELDNETKQPKRITTTDGKDKISHSKYEPNWLPSDSVYSESVN